MGGISYLEQSDSTKSKQVRMTLGALGLPLTEDQAFTVMMAMKFLHAKKDALDLQDIQTIQEVIDGRVTQ